jgi:hypothetical protein
MKGLYLDEDINSIMKGSQNGQKKQLRNPEIRRLKDRELGWRINLNKFKGYYSVHETF